MEGSAHYEGRAVDVFVRPIGEGQPRQGLGDGATTWSRRRNGSASTTSSSTRKIWTAGRRSEDGWRDYDPGNTAGKAPETVAVLEHRDHVHVDVLD